ncbi:MAG: hypothetical protein HUJ68_09825 [Clostridia bacterium]|nr:hypothetical protein [Clostridia bacterium]
MEETCGVKNGCEFYTQNGTDSCSFIINNGDIDLLTTNPGQDGHLQTNKITLSELQAKQLAIFLYNKVLDERDKAVLHALEDDGK